MLAPTAVLLVCGLLTAQLALVFAPEVGLRGALRAAWWGTLSAALVLLFLGVGTAMMQGPGESTAAPATSAAVSRGRRSAWPVMGSVGALAGASAVVAVALAGQPARLTLTLYCFVLLSGAAWWIVRRSGGPTAAAGAVAGLTLLTVVASTAQYPSLRLLEDWRPDSPYRWSVGWPTEEWRVRHTVQLPGPAPARELRLRLFLAQEYDGPARLYAAVNGHDLGAASVTGEVHVDVPVQYATGASRLEFVLRQAPVDPRLRVLASRWTQGASLSATASGFFLEGVWLPGTFNDATGRRQAGVLAAHLEGLE
ncbi:MAG: hypothetical protein M3442_08215 [Chloroflexota bacterium]|nr:hypothetical protein [Chloroflexota bacterium]